MTESQILVINSFVLATSTLSVFLMLPLRLQLSDVVTIIQMQQNISILLDSNPQTMSTSDIDLKGHSKTGTATSLHKLQPEEPEVRLAWLSECTVRIHFTCVSAFLGGGGIVFDHTKEGREQILKIGAQNPARLGNEKPLDLQTPLYIRSADKQRWR